MEDHAADELDVEVTHAHGALAGFADYGEGLGEDGGEGGFFGGDAFVFVFRGVGDVFEGVGDALAEFGGFVAQLFVGERLDGGLEVINLPHGGHEALYGAFVAGSKDFRYGFVEQNRYPS